MSKLEIKPGDNLSDIQFVQKASCFPLSIQKDQRLSVETESTSLKSQIINFQILFTKIFFPYNCFNQYICLYVEGYYYPEGNGLNLCI